MESEKTTLINLFSGQQWRNRHREQIYGHGGKGEGEMYRESNMEIYNSICKIDTQWEFAVWLRELKQGLCDKLKGGMFWREETLVYLWLILANVWQKTTIFCKAIILQFKNKHTYTHKNHYKTSGSLFYSQNWKIIDHSIMIKGRLS